jgi:uncharacterized membrane protein
MRGSGGTDGGIGKYSIGLFLSILAVVLFFDSVRVSTASRGIFCFYGYETTSMGIVFIPFFLGVVALFYNSRWKWAWVLMYVGIGVIAIEILSRIRFLLYMKTTHLMFMMIMFAAGLGLMIRSYRKGG